MPSPTLLPRPDRPFTLKALCLILIGRGLLFLLLVFLMLDGQLTHRDIGGLSGFSAGVVATAFIILGVILIVSAVGLWRFRPWAWRLTMILVGLLIIYGLWVEFSGGRELANAIGLLVNIFIVFYLVQGDVRGLFVETTAAWENI